MITTSYSRSVPSIQRTAQKKKKKEKTDALRRKFDRNSLFIKTSNMNPLPPPPLFPKSQPGPSPLPFIAFPPSPQNPRPPHHPSLSVRSYATTHLHTHTLSLSFSPPSPLSLSRRHHQHLQFVCERERERGVFNIARRYRSEKGSPLGNEPTVAGGFRARCCVGWREAGYERREREKESVC